MFTECYQKINLGMRTSSELNDENQWANTQQNKHPYSDTSEEIEETSINYRSQGQRINQLGTISDLLESLLKSIQEDIPRLKNQTCQIINQIASKIKIFDRDNQQNQQRCINSKLSEHEEEYKFLLNQFNIERKDLIQLKQFYESELVKLKQENEELNQENFMLGQRIASMEEDQRQEVETSNKIIRQEYQKNWVNYQKTLREQIQRIMKTKDEVIMELRKVIDNLQNGRKDHKNEKDIDYLFRSYHPLSPKLVQSPATSTIELLPYLQDKKPEKGMDKSSLQKLKQELKIKTQIQLVQQKSNRFTFGQSQISPISPIKPKHNRLLSTQYPLVQFKRTQLKGFQRVTSPKLVKVNIQTIQKKLQLLSSKLRQQLTSMNSVKK